MAIIARWGRLERLRLDNPAITDVGLARLGRLPALRSLILVELVCEVGPYQGIRWTTRGITWTGRTVVEPDAFPFLDELSLRVRLASGADLHLLGQLLSLKSLCLGGRSIRDDDLRHFASLRALESLSFEEATLDGSGFRHLSDLPSLSEVSIESPNITDATLPYFARLSHLTEVSLTATKITPTSLGVMRDAPHLSTLRITPPICGDLARLQQTLPGYYLDFSIEPF